MSKGQYLAFAPVLVALIAARDLRAQTTYYVEPAAAASVGVDGSTNMTTLADLTVTGGATNQNRAITNTTAPAGTARWRVREGGVDTRTGQEFFRAYTPVYAAATNIAAGATAHADFYLNTTGTSVVAKATLYEYNDTTGIVGAAKGTASYTGNAAVSTRQAMNNVSFGNSSFTVAAGNRLLVIFSFDMSNVRPAYLWGQASSATPSGYESFTVMESPAVTPPGSPGTPTYTNVAVTSVTVNWTPGTGATSYNVQRATDSAFTLNLTTLTGVTSPYNDVGPLSASTVYWYRVVALNAGGSTTGAASSVTTLTPELRVIPGVPTTAVNLCTRVTVEAPFTGDANGNSATGFARGTSGAGPFTAVAGCTAVGGPSPRSCVDATVSASTTYYYQATFTDADGVVGTNPQVTSAVSTPACNALDTTVGTATALASGCSQITVSAPFAGDANATGSTSVEFNTVNAWPGTAACLAVGASPRACLATGLAASSTYYVRVTTNDPDGVVGTNPQVLGPLTTPACAGNGVAPMILFLSPSRNATVGGAETFKVQIHAPNGIAAANILYSVDGGASSPVTLNANYSCGAACAVYQFPVPTAALANGPHVATIKATDGSLFVAQASQPFVVNNAGGVAAGSGHVLRRTSGSQLCLDCHALATHSSQSTSYKYGSWSLECSSCHTPHGTPNVYLVKPKIDTPSSGSSSVNFQNTTGVAANSFGTPQASGNGANVCEVCHTKTRNADASPRARNNAPTDWTKHYSSSCTGCHPHGKGFAAGESEGGATCSGCHASIWSGMQAGSAKTTKHTLSVDTFSDSAVTWGNPLSGNAAAARSCVNMCHEDHPHTLTSPATASHENNVYMDATSLASRAAAVRTSADKDKSDFESGQTSGGMCVSCHRNPVDAAHPAVAQATFAASAHNATSTTPGGAWQLTLHDGSNFSRNCTKCHWDAADGTTPAIAGKTGVGAVHSNVNPSLLMGTTNPASVPASFICYRCHGGGTTGADYSSKAVFQDGTKAARHPVDADGVHGSVTELANAAWGNTLGVTGRHANCLDCHVPHENQKSVKQGTVTASTTTTLTDSAMSGRWVANEWVGSTLYVPSLPAGQNTRTITATTAAGVLTVAAWTAAPAAGTAYLILDNKADGALAGAWGAQLSTNPALWTAPAAGNFTKKTIAAGSDLQATLCFKCHSSYYWGAGTPPNGMSANGTATTPVETDVAMEFNPANRSGHPVLAGLASYSGSTAVGTPAAKGLIAAQMLAPWNVNLGAQTMSCNDCHNTDAASPAAQGPHGSAVPFMIKNGASKPGWPTAAASAAGFATTFCSDCHVNAWIHTVQTEHSIACYSCHIVIPHGGKVSRLIATNGPGMPTRYAYSNNLSNVFLTRFTKNINSSYVETNCGSNNASCNNHSTTSGESW